MYYLHICLVFKVIFTVLADCANLMVYMYSSESRSWPIRNNSQVCKAIFTFLADCVKLMVVHVLLWILIYGN